MKLYVLKIANLLYWGSKIIHIPGNFQLFKHKVSPDEQGN